MSNRFSLNDGNIDAGRQKHAIQAEQARLEQALQRRMAEHNAAASGTHRLAARRTFDSARKSWMPSLTRSGSASHYVVLPADLAATADLATTPRWRIELHGLDGSIAMIGFDLIGDVVIGRGKEESAAPDMDLEQFNAQKLGVSRRHVILRPTEKHLYLIDLNSTNGTMHNGLPVGPGVARSVQHNDTIALGDLTFTLKIVARPAIAVQRLTSQAEDASRLQQEAKHKAQGHNLTMQITAVSRPTPKSNDVDTPAHPIPRPIPSTSAETRLEQSLPPAPLSAKPAKIMEIRAKSKGKNE